MRRAEPGRNGALAALVSPGARHSLLRFPLPAGFESGRSRSNGGALQAKLKVGSPNDEFEREADRALRKSGGRSGDRSRRAPEKRRG